MTEQAPARPKVKFQQPPPWLDSWLEMDRIQPPSSPTVAFPDCTGCGHREHGLPCQSTYGGNCACPSSFQARDDSWRPNVTYRHDWAPEGAMHLFGCDGWVAKAIVGIAPLASRLRRLMHGGGSES